MSYFLAFYAFAAVATLAVGLFIIARARARYECDGPEATVAAVFALIAALVWPLIVTALLLVGAVEAEAHSIRRRAARAAIRRRSHSQ